MKTLLIALASIYVGVSAAGGALLMEGAIHRNVQFPVHTDDYFRADDLVELLDARLETVSITASDGATLAGWLFTPIRPNSHSVVLLHGIAVNRAAMLPIAQAFVEQG